MYFGWNVNWVKRYFGGNIILGETLFWVKRYWVKRFGWNVIGWNIIGRTVTTPFGDEIDPDTSVQHQLSRWKIVLNLYHSLWEQEYTRRRLTVTWREQGKVPKVGDIVLFKNEPIYRHSLSAARIVALLHRKNGDVFGAQISYRREVGGRLLTVSRHLSQLYPFSQCETTSGTEEIRGLTEDAAAGIMTSGTSNTRSN